MEGWNKKAHDKQKENMFGIWKGKLEFHLLKKFGQMRFLEMLEIIEGRVDDQTDRQDCRFGSSGLF